jgi:transposase
VARDFDIHRSVLRRWVRQYREDREHSFPGKGHLKPEDEELRRLKRRNAELEEEVAILKKAMAIFTRPPR